VNDLIEQIDTTRTAARFIVTALVFFRLIAIDVTFFINGVDHAL
jgi:hypothetical protein